MLKSGRRERLRKGEKYKELGAMTLFLFISFWKCHSSKRKFPPCSLQLWMEVDSLFWILDERLLFHDLLLKKKILILIPKAMKPPMWLVKSSLYFTGCVAGLATHTHTHTHTHTTLFTHTTESYFKNDWLESILDLIKNGENFLQQWLIF